MCMFFSFCTEPNYHPGERFFLDWNLRKLSKYRNSGDSHSRICNVFGLAEGICNKFEFNPFTREFTVDKINSEVNDSVQAEKWVRSLDFKNIIPALILKPIIDPFEISVPDEPTVETLKLLKKWAAKKSVYYRSAHNEISLKLCSAGFKEAYETLIDVLNDLFSGWLFDYIRTRNRGMVFVAAYATSFFDVKYRCNYTPAIKLWERGYFPIKVWRNEDWNWELFSGRVGRRKVFTITDSDLRKIR